MFDPCVRKIPWRRERLPGPVLWPRGFQGLYSPWGCKELDTSEKLDVHLTFLFSVIGNMQEIKNVSSLAPNFKVGAH